MVVNTITSRLGGVGMTSASLSKCKDEVIFIELQKEKLTLDIINIKSLSVLLLLLVLKFRFRFQVRGSTFEAFSSESILEIKMTNQGYNY